MLLLLLLLSSVTSHAMELGEIDVYSRRQEAGEVRSTQVGSQVKKEELSQYLRSNVGDAMNLLPGVALSTNARNEKIISIRGFDSRQVPVFIDGVPVYVPFDGYLDLNRFTTSDLLQIDVAKGMSSVVFGPNTIGGAVNLISRRPVKPLEVNSYLGGGTGDEIRAGTNVGGRKGNWYYQTGISGVKSRTFPVPGDGNRENAWRRDGKLTLKAGYNPKPGTEHVLKFDLHNGSKGQPPSTDPAKVRYWKWPYWNKKGVSYIGEMKATDSEKITLRLYRDLFDNKIDMYSGDNYSEVTSKSTYHDRSDGGSITLMSGHFDSHAITLVQHVKIDDHREVDGTGSLLNHFQDRILTTGAEDAWILSDKWTIEFGAAYHEQRPQDVFSRVNAYSVPHLQTAQDFQAGLFHTLTPGDQLYVTAARKSRLPTMKDRFSQRLNLFVPNPDLGPERSLNLELGGKKKRDHFQVESAVFLNDVRDKIQTVTNAVGTKSQAQNVDRVRMYGGEFAGKWVKGKSEVSGNYTYTFIKNLRDETIRVTDIPRHKALVTFSQHFSQSFMLSPFFEYNSRRWTSNTKELPGFLTYNLRMSVKVSKEFLVEAGGTNLSDHRYSLSDGFPSPGRMYFAQLRYDL